MFVQTVSIQTLGVMSSLLASTTASSCLDPLLEQLQAPAKLTRYQALRTLVDATKNDPQVGILHQNLLREMSLLSDESLPQVSEALIREVSTTNRPELEGLVDAHFRSQKENPMQCLLQKMKPNSLPLA